MEISTMYIVSQIFTIMMYIMLGISYFSKKRKNILILNTFSGICEAGQFIFLKAYTGVSMCIVAYIRNLIFYIEETKINKKQLDKILHYLILIILVIIIVISTIITYTGIGCIFPAIATIIYTYSVWQKETKYYKLLGIICGIFNVLYDIYVKSIFGVLLESILLICSISGFLIEQKSKMK